ncbi:MAG TPA: MarR family transcriptional regulator, partial [Candidatus Limnocylindrales bacterium]|nr:MarR family transcriptional regulator [Candidatus Limnocylindrales bacterium]
AGVTARLDGVERNGLAVRSRDPRDRRGVIVTLTGKGQKLVRDAAQALFARQSFIPSLYSERERKQLLALLRRLLGSIERTGPGVSLPAYETAAAAWLEAFPQANPWLIEFLLILAMLSVRINRRGDELLGPFDLSQTALCILAALRRSGDRHRLSPRALSEAALLSSGGMTAQLDQLEGRGLVERSRDLTDRRGIQVMLTRSGQKLADPALAAYLAGHQRMLTGLSPPDRQALATLLRTLLLATEPDPRPDPSLSSAHLIGPRRRRRTAIIPGPGSALP